MHNFWIVFLLISSNMIPDLYSQGHCPVYCSTCLPTYISCTANGLSTIPVQLQPATEKIVLSNQFLFHGVLTNANFSELTPPKYRIQQFSIRSSSVQELRSRTFSQLTYLTYLDLSENQRLTILSSAFDGLRLNYLKLDDIGKLMLLSGCFVGLTTESLSMNNSRLQSLSYDIFSPLSSTLKHLFIENNQIRTIDQRFEPLFYRLDSVNLKENPLICYCPLLWLSKALRSKMNSYKYNTKSSDAHDINIFPKCVAPTYLRNRQLQSITEAEFNCQVPFIASIEIDLVTMQHGQMSCKIMPEENGHTIPTKIFWQENQTPGDNFNDKSPATENRMFYDESETRDSLATVKISANAISRQRHFQCVAENTAGRSTMVVQITWPLRVANNSSSSIQNYTNRNTDPDLSINHHHLNNLAPDTYMFTKHYTLLEMTLAIVGTFIITVFIFLLFYRFYFRRKNGYKSGKKSLKYSLNNTSPDCTKRSLMAFHSPRSGYTAYETSMHYSDSSQTYDSIPHNAVYPQQPPPPFANLTNSPSMHFIDYKTHKNLYPNSPCV